MQSSITPNGNIIPATQAWHCGRCQLIWTCRGPCGSVQREAEYEYGGENMQCIWIPLTLYACFSSQVELPESHMNQCTWLGLPWILGPTVCLSPSRTHTHKRGFSNLEMWVSEISSKILCRWGAVSSCSCEAGELSNTQRLCWPRPLANLGCRQHRVLGDLNQSVKVSAPPSLSIFSSCKDSSPTPLPRLPPSDHPFFLS